MKKLFLFLLALSILFVSCSKDGQDNPVAGLVSFASDPVYDGGQISFKAQIQFSTAGEAVDIEFRLLDGDDIVHSDAIVAENVDGGLGLFYETAEITVSLTPISSFSGKELTVWLDPENKITASEYTDETNVNLWKKETVSIP